MNVSQCKVKGHNTNQMIYRGGSAIAFFGWGPAPKHFILMLQLKRMESFLSKGQVQVIRFGLLTLILAEDHSTLATSILHDNSRSREKNSPRST